MIDWVFRSAPVLLVIVGWAVVNHQNNLRETRKERRKAADEAKSIAKELSQLAVIYYTKADRDKELPIKNLLDELEIELSRLPKNGTNTLEMTALINCLNELRDAITLDPFESDVLKPLDSDSNILRTIALSKNRLLGQIEKTFANSNEFC